MDSRYHPLHILILCPILITIFLSGQAIAQIDSWPGDEPAMFRAYDEYRAGDFEESANLLGKWLAVQPNDTPSWYTYACVLALTGKDSAAVLALEAALDAGGFPADWSLQDPDLVSLYEMELFKSVVARMKKIEEERAEYLGGARWIEQTRAGSYRLELPKSYKHESDEQLPVIMFLHGASGTLFDGKPVAEHLIKAGFAVILLEAAYRSTDGIGFNHWPSDNLEQGSAIDSIPVQTVANNMNMKWYREVLSDAAAYANLDLDHVILTGFSQGAAQTLWAVANDPEAYHAAAVIGARVPKQLREDGAFSDFGKQGRFRAL